MKKVIALFFAVVMLLSLCACGKSDNAKVCEGLIGKIGEVTLDSGETWEHSHQRIEYDYAG